MARRSPEATPPPPPASDLFSLYSKMLRDRAESLASVFRVTHGPTTASEVFVQVCLSARTESLKSDIEAPFGHAHRDLGRLLGQGKGALPDRPFPLEEVVGWPHRRWAVLGDPGSGKTTLLRHAALALLKPDGPLPIYLKVSELGPDLRQTLVHAYSEGCADWLVSQIRTGRAALFIDGLDEATDTESAADALRQLGAAAGDCPIIVASRPIGFSEPSADYVVLAICPLAPDQQRALLLKWVGDARAVDRALDRLSRAPRLRRLAENPLLLTLAGLVLREGEDLPQRRGALYERAVGVLLKKSASPSPAARSLRAPTEALDLLSWAALRLHGRAGESYPTRDLVAVFNEDPRLQKSLQQNWANADAFLAEVAEVTGLLVPDSADLRNARGYAFPHRTFREFLAACALERDIGAQGVGLRVTAPASAVPAPPTPVAEIALPPPRLGFWAWLLRWLGLGPQLPPPYPPAKSPEPPQVSEAPAPGELGRVLAEARLDPVRWSEVLALTCGRLGSGGADALVRRVAAEEDTPLLLRVVADAEGISAATVHEVLKLEAGWQSWEARKKVLEEIPGLVGDPAIAVGLIEQFVRTTSDGNDLFWAREVLRGLARGEGAPAGSDEAEARRAAATLAENIFGHLPADRLDEARKQLQAGWKNIPEGSFLMGSPEGDAQGLDDERPQHKVTFSAGFQMQAVLVTWRIYEMFDPGHAAARDDFGGKIPVPEQETHPVYRVTWYAATMFAEWVGARLPREVEWEYACRAGTRTQYWCGDTEADLKRVGWYGANSRGHTHPVAELPANPWGLHDMHGNVWEWCADAWKDTNSSRQRSVMIDPNVPHVASDTSVVRGIRGGSWDAKAQNVRSACQERNYSDTKVLNLGFRLVRPVPPADSGS